MELLRAFDCKFETHPEMPEGNNHPDFLVNPNSAESFYLEAASINPSKDEVRDDVYKSQILEHLKKIQNTQYHLTTHITGILEEQPSGRQIRGKVEAWLRNLNYQEVYKEYEAKGDAATMKYENPGSDWTLIVKAWPTSESGFRVGSVGLAESNTVYQTIRKTINRKGPHYGTLDKPYVIALNLGPIKFANDYDVYTALFGFEQIHLQLMEDGTIRNEGTTRSGEDGALFDRNAPKNKRISALLVVQNLRPDTVRRSQTKLFHNPWAKFPYDSILTRLSQMVVNGDEYKEVEGVEIGELFQFPDDYP